VKTLGILLFTVALSSLLPRQSHATVYTSDGSAANVQSIHNTVARNGDTITIPAGTFTWAAQVTLSKAVKLKGQGGGRVVGDTKSQAAIGTGPKTFITTRAIPGITAGQTLRIAKMLNYAGVGRENYMVGTVTSYSGNTLVLNVTQTGGSGVYRFWYIATNPRTTIVGGKVSVNQSSSANTEISGIHFVTSISNTLRPIDISGSTRALPKTLVHDCWFQNGTGGGNACIQLNTNQAVIWNCSFDSADYLNVTALKMAYDGDGQSWRTSSTMGMADTNGATNLYVEDCDFRGYLNLCDWDSSSRVVMRHNLFDNSGLGSHGADTSPVGLRHIEIYDNELVFDNFGDCDGSITANQNWFFWMRGGTAVITDNILPAISSCAWGNKGNVLFSVLNIRRDTGPYCCWDNYPAPHQIGQGYGNGAVFHQYISQCGSYSGVDYSYYIYAEPVYIWNNSGGGGNRTGLNEEDADSCGSNQHLANWVQNGRDYIIGPKPGYQKFTYPHPLRAAAPPPSPSPSPSPSPDEAGRAVIADFNHDGNPDYLLRRNGAGETAIWYLNNGLFVGSAYGPTLPLTWTLVAAADFNNDLHSDYVLVYPASNYTAIAYMSGPTLIGAAAGPTLPPGWEVVGAADFNGDGKPDFVLYKASSRQTALWYLNNAVFIGGDYGPSIPNGWSLVGVADFDRDGHTDYLLFNESTGQSAIWYLSGPNFAIGAYGPTIPSGWVLVATADFNRDGHPDFLLYNASTRATAIWYLVNNIAIGSAFGPTLPAAWGWPAP
jgi:hypothetical protein